MRFHMIVPAQCFNPRAREGRDHRLTCPPPERRVSIHAPARGATLRAHQRHLFALFQSTRPRGARQRRFITPSTFSSFNPRAREGRDLRPFFCFRGSGRFNPRAREGRDRIITLTTAHLRVSIHAPARGATPFFRPIAVIELFQSTRPRGARHVRESFRYTHNGFNPRAREGRDTRRTTPRPPPHRFNPRAREGRDARRRRD